jgi:23S rRNA pseudouridine2605 synthase
MEERIRLQKYMAQCGVASRRHAEHLILEGRVRVNGQTVTQLGTTVTPRDRIECDGKLIKPEKNHVYIMLNKPSGYVTTVSDPEGRPTSHGSCFRHKERIYPLDVLIMTPPGFSFSPMTATLL